eukprot:TRINITY_DN35_c0_g1_i1.p2 TRINITY_DN35_c0_g1~~TRINITY_DN35_c0_g1_i1.p2  ORF type:complete len:113 (+),score=24.03 TRINITY_DN35_c0_g1_i1:231-569(+)
MKETELRNRKKGNKRVRKKEINNCIDSEEVENGFSGSTDPLNKTETYFQDKEKSSKNEKNKRPEEPVAYRFSFQCVTPTGFFRQALMFQTGFNVSSVTTPRTANRLLVEQNK